MTSSWPPKRTFWKFWANFRRFSPIWRLKHRNCSHHSVDYFGIKFFPKFITILALWRHLDTQKRTFWAFWANFADFRLFDDYNIEIILENHGWDCSQYSGDQFKIKFFPKFITILALWRHLDPEKCTFWAFLAIFCRFLPIWRL